MTGPSAATHLSERAAGLADLLAPPGERRGRTPRVARLVAEVVLAATAGPAAARRYRDRSGSNAAVARALTAVVAGAPVPDLGPGAAGGTPDGWWQAAVAAVDEAAGRGGGTSDAQPDGFECARQEWWFHRRVADLGQAAELRRATAPPAPRWARPMVARLDRRQAAFDAAFTAALAAAYGVHRQPDHGDSEVWARALARREADEVADATARLADLERRPLVSVVVPTYETPESDLRACVRSVQAQLYDRWELCIADDGSSAPVRRVLGELAGADPRIHVTLLPGNGGISVATNAALALATGEYVAFLDHDDVLASHALAEVALRLARHPETGLLYSDEDRIDRRGLHVRPFFKPDWSPDLLQACNYVRHLLVARSDLVEEVGGVRSAFDGAQDYDLALRLSERAARVEHIPRVLYHWREAPGSLAGGADNKPYAGDAGLRAVRDHLDRTGRAGTTVTHLGTHYHVAYPVPSRGRVSVVIACGPDSPAAADPLGPLAPMDDIDVEVIVVGARATPGPGGSGHVRQVPWAGPFRPAAMRNEGARHAHGEVIVFLDDGLQPVEGDGPADGWLRELVGHARRPEIGAVGAKVVYPDGTVEHAGIAVDADGRLRRPFAHLTDGWSVAGHLAWPRNYRAVAGAAVALRSTVFHGAGGFDAALTADGAAADLCLRLHEGGRRVLFDPHAVLVRRSPPPEGDTGHSFTAPPGAADPDPNPVLAGPGGIFGDGTAR